jgi:pilus assembly protein CpaE
MHHPLNVLVTGRSKETLAPVVALLKGQRALSLETQVVGNGESDSLRQRPSPPDVLVLTVEKDWQSSLWGLVDALPSHRPPFVVVSPESDMELLRAAMRAGARDAFSLPFDREDFISAIATIAEEERLRTGEPSGRLTAFMNTKGGSGASFLAANISSVLATMADSRTILVDMDFQFGGLPIYLNMPARNGLIRALELVDDLDEAALQGYTQGHSSGLHLLTAAMEDIILPEDVSEHRVRKLLSVLEGIYRNIVIDLPRRIDTATAAVLLRADLVVLVTQQSIAHLHDTKRLCHLLQDQLGIPTERLLLLLNRFEKKAQISDEDFASISAGLAIEDIPGDFRRVSESINLGVPVHEGGQRSALGKRLVELATLIGRPGQSRPPKGKRIFGWLSR